MHSMPDVCVRNSYFDQADQWTLQMGQGLSLDGWRLRTTGVVIPSV